jgi:hypothetical protein
VDYGNVVAVAGVCVGQQMTKQTRPPLDEVQDVLAALAHALDLLERLQSAQHSGNIHLEKTRTKMLWAVRRLTQRTWVLATQIQNFE